MNNPEEVSLSKLSTDLEKYQADQKHLVLRHALTSNLINTVVHSQDKAIDLDFTFSIDIPTMSVTDQKASGRCWIFAALNLLREIIAKKANITNFELSQSYLAFYDKLEKMNYALETIIDLVNVEPDDRTFAYILTNGIADGGQWDMFVSLVKKYGVVPKAAMIETAQSSNTLLCNQLLNSELKRFSAKAQKLFRLEGMASVRELKDKVMSNVYSFLLDCYGIPPKDFAFEYVDKDKKFHRDEGLNAKAFFDKYIGKSIDEYVSVINSPTDDKPFVKTYTIRYLGNVIGGKEIQHLNLPMERMKELILNQLKKGELVWFGSDVGRYGDREKGIWDNQTYDFLSAFGLDFIMEKGDSLIYRNSMMTHAMVITGVNLVNEIPNKWKIQNSWGAEKGASGYYIMSSSWFDQYVYQAVINKKYLNEKEIEALKGDSIVLKPWDPMGALAD